MMRRAIVALSVAAIAASSLSQADPPASPTRDDYDAYLVAYTMEQHVVSCRTYAPGVYSSFAETVERWRTENGETMLRLEAAARAWPLPGARSLDSILESMSRSTDEYYAEGKGELTDARCKRLLERVAGSAT